MIQINTIDKRVVEMAVKILKKGGLVVFPTETVYGIGADATNSKAIAKLTEYKQRPYGKPYSVAVSSLKMAQDYVVLNATAKNLYKQFLPGPMTIISKGKHKLAKGVESENGSLGIRIPDYPLILNIVDTLGRPITATSANASYQKRPYKISDIFENISAKQKGLIDLVIDAGTLPTREPSTVVDTTMDDLVILRSGDIKLKNKEEILSKSEEATFNLGKELWQKFETYKRKRPIVFALEGEMGVGKTILTKGVARAIGYKDVVLSPTFNILNTYTSKELPSFYHFDAWRIESDKEFELIGFDDLLKNKNTVVSIEWAEKVRDLIRNHSEDALIVWVIIKIGKDDNERIISWGVM